MSADHKKKLAQKRKQVKQPVNAVAEPVTPSLTADQTVVSAPEPVLVTPAHTESPVDVSTDVPAPVPVAEQGEKKVRSQTSKLLGVDISPARVRRYLDKLNINQLIDSESATLKQYLAAYKTAESQLASNTEVIDVEGVPTTIPLSEAGRVAAKHVIDTHTGHLGEYESKLSALSHERTRFSNSASIALAVICNELISQLAQHSMASVIAAKKKIVQAEHIHGDGVEKLSLFPLLNGIPLFDQTAADIRELNAKKATVALIERALSAQYKELKKKWKFADEEKPQQKPAEEEEVAAESENEQKGSKTSFKHYVHNLFKNTASSDPNYNHIRMSANAKAYLSNLLIQLIHRISTLVLLTTHSMKNKTVNQTAILRTVETLLIDGHNATRHIEFSTKEVPDPLLLKKELQIKKDTDAARKLNQSIPEYKVDVDSMPKVTLVVATQHSTYPTAAYDKLRDHVLTKLRKYKESGLDLQADE